MNETGDEETRSVVDRAKDKETKAQYVKYDRHGDEWDRVIKDPERAKVGRSWLRSDTVDAWRHDRMRLPLKAIISSDVDASWLTIGDGRYGTDANFLLRSGVKRVHCTDISDTLLKEGASCGFITEFSAQNAEALNFDDNSFDYVYCKEAFHHFPRAFVALYEMFRVARKGVVITEPRDNDNDPAPLTFVRDIAKRIVRRRADIATHSFETVGNYVYTVSERELEKFMLGMHYRDIAFTGLNDAYIQGVEFASLASRDPKDVAIKRRVERSIALQDIISGLKLRKSRLLTAALFKIEPHDAMRNALKEMNWRVKKLPANPYL